jgi:hypothetical protein
MMDILIVEDGKYVPYVRTGKCLQCGQCCCTNEIDAQVQFARCPDSTEDDGNVEDLSEWNGFSAFKAQGLWFWFKFNIHDKNRTNECGSFVDGRCTCWKDDDFPALCRYWPVHPRDLEKFPDCGFHFEREL